MKDLLLRMELFKEFVVLSRSWLLGILNCFVELNWDLFMGFKGIFLSLLRELPLLLLEDKIPPSTPDFKGGFVMFPNAILN